ncbi:23S rRNA (uracil(1939)-C(5))-methyltransferase RlmD [soil metagenome]
MSNIYKVGDVLEVRVEKIVPRGLGLAFAEKLTVFVPLSAPGDELRVRITELKKRIAFAEIIEVTKAGPDRVEPPCVYFGACGGCNFQQLRYEAQLRAKLDIINDCLQRIGKIDLDSDIAIIPSPLEYDYRSRARWQLDSAWRKFGYFRRDSHEVIDVEGCPVLAPPLEHTLRNIRATMEWANFPNGSEVVAASGDGGSVSIRSSVGVEPAVEITYSDGDEVYGFSAEAFFQANQSLIPRLVECATGGAEGETALDLYSGVGLFTLPLARTFASVVAVEGDPKAVEFAKSNLRNTGMSNVRILRSGVGRFLAENTPKADFVLVDPPRSGTERGVIAAIAAMEPAHISYVSCEPSILARDLESLLDQGYRIDSITALDLFPQTHHVETVVRLSKA